MDRLDPGRPRTPARASRRRPGPVVVATLVIALAAVVTAPAIARASVPGLDWTALPADPVDLPEGWQAARCEGDAPLLCTAEAGIPQGAVAHLAVALAGSELGDELAAGIAVRTALIREVRRVHAAVAEDRESTCPGTTYIPDPTVGATVGGLPGVRYGFTLLADGRAVERTIGAMAVRDPGGDPVLDVVSAEQLAEGSCIGAEGTQPFTDAGLDRFAPILLQLVARSSAGSGGGTVPAPAAGALAAEDAVATSVAVAARAPRSTRSSWCGPTATRTRHPAPTRTPSPPAPSAQPTAPRSC
jgi:hypothetical protein